MNKTTNDVLSAIYCLKTMRCRKIIFNWLGVSEVTKDSCQTGQEQLRVLVMINWGKRNTRMLPMEISMFLTENSFGNVLRRFPVGKAAYDCV
jgi:hypothetical protein